MRVLSVFLMALVLGILPLKQSQAAQLADDYDFLAECSAVFSFKADKERGMRRSDVIDSYIEAAARFYELASKGGDPSLSVYKTKLKELRSMPPNDPVGTQAMKALEVQCRHLGKDKKISIK